MEQSIHDRWASDATLTALVPATRFVTGQQMAGAALPYATLSRIGRRRVIRTSSRSIAEEVVRFDIVAAELGTLRQVAAAVRARFDRQTFTGAANLLRMRREEESQQQSPDGVWRLSLVYLAKVE